MRILVINRVPLGRATDTFKLCEHASVNHEIHHLGFDSSGESAAGLPRVVVHTVPWRGFFGVRYWRWIRACISQISQGYDRVYVYYFPTCAQLRLLFPRTTLILDIRTGSVASSQVRRLVSNLGLMIEARFFDHVNIVSEGLRSKLHLPGARILPLGADPLPIARKSFRNLHLLYVGTLSGRRIHETLEGFAAFHRETSKDLDLRYTIVGSGFDREEDELRRLAKSLGVAECVEIAGYVPHSSLLPYFERANVGISYVPITSSYDHQPPTKTFEYLMAGMPVIATNTTENRRIVGDSTGMLIADSAEGFHLGLRGFEARRQEFDSDTVRASVAGDAWKELVTKYALPFIERPTFRSEDLA